MKYIALLRGVNVGGKNKLSMADLKRVLEHEGFTDVYTYINSGNIIFSKPNMTAEQAKVAWETLLAEHFNLHVPVAIVTEDELMRALQNAPAWWDNDAQSKHNAIFIISPASSADIFKQVGEAKPEFEKVASYGNVIFWSAPLATFSHTRWSKVSGYAAYGNITIRNANTTKKLAALLTQ